jgi:hypothetical protein
MTCQLARRGSLALQLNKGRYFRALLMRLGSYPRPKPLLHDLRASARRCSSSSACTKILLRQVASFGEIAHKPFWLAEIDGAIVPFAGSRGLSAHLAEGSVGVGRIDVLAIAES